MAIAYFYTYNAVFDKPVSGQAKLAYAYLCKCADAHGKSWPSHKAIAAACGICVTTVKKALAELEAACLIQIRGQARPDMGRRSNIYTLVKKAVKGYFVTYANVFGQALTAKARIVYLYFCRLASGRGAAFPSHRATAAACGMSVSGARAAIDELEGAGLIERQAQYRVNGGQRANLYTFADPGHGGTAGGGMPETAARQAQDPPAPSGMRGSGGMGHLKENCAEMPEARPESDAGGEPCGKLDEAAHDGNRPAPKHLDGRTCGAGASADAAAHGRVGNPPPQSRQILLRPATGFGRRAAPRIAATKHPPMPYGGQRNLTHNCKEP